MKRLLLVALVLCVSAAGFAQTIEPPSPAPQPPSYANYSIMLVNPANGGGVVIMHNPKNMLEFVDVSKTKEAFAAGYAPVRAVELQELITSFKEEIARLSDENKRLRGDQVRQVSAPPVPQGPSPADVEAQQRAQMAAEQEARRQQVLQMWMRLQPQTLNMNVNSNVHLTNCNQFPALCVR